MFRSQKQMPAWLRFVCTHNPFYLISAALVLYGLHVSFHDRTSEPDGWYLVQWLCGYAALLLAAATLIVRVGKVWQDARSILLLIVLIFVSIGSSFDRACLDNPGQGAQFLAAGMLFVVLLTELALPCLNIQFPMRYRIPFYLQLGLLFFMPVGLAYLSVTDQEPLMTWFVMMFPGLAGIAVLTLMPAAMPATLE